jgi:hypothetical protein
MPGITSTVKKNISSSLFSSQFAKTDQIVSESAWPFEVSIGPAKTGTLTVRTDANTGSLTMTGGHGITTGALLDVYWDGGSRRGMTVGTVATNVVPIDGGSGDDLPIATTPITAMVPDLQIGSVVGDDAVGVFVYSEQKGGVRIVYDDTGDADAVSADIPAGSTYSWFDGIDGTNPLAGQTIIKVYLSHGDSSSARILRGAIQYNS